MSPNHIKFISIGAVDVTNPCEFIGFGAMDVTKPFKFIGFGAMGVTKPYTLIRFGASHGPDLPWRQEDIAEGPVKTLGGHPAPSIP